MSKSLGNFYTLKDITDKGYDPMAFRLMILQAHYRSQVNFTWESLEAAQNRLHNWQALADLRFQPIIADNHELNELDYTEYQKTTLNHLQNDLDTPQALSTISSVADERSSSIYDDELGKFYDVYTVHRCCIGFEPARITRYHHRTKAADCHPPTGTRHQRDWAASDKLRDELSAQGIGVRDTPARPHLVPRLITVARCIGEFRPVRLRGFSCSAARRARQCVRSQPPEWPPIRRITHQSSHL